MANCVEPTRRRSTRRRVDRAQTHLPTRGRSFPRTGHAIFEVDHPATQASKIKRVKKVLGTIPTNVVYVPIDFDEETLDKLLAYGFDRRPFLN